MRLMSAKTLTILTSVLVTASLVAEPLAATAGTLRQIGTWGRGMHSGVSNQGVSNLTCDSLPGVGSMPQIPHTPGVSTIHPHVMPGVSGGFNKPFNAFNFSRPLSVTGGDITINKTIDNSKTLNVYKDNSVTNNIDNSKTISIYKPVTITKNIDNSKVIDAS